MKYDEILNIPLGQIMLKHCRQLSLRSKKSYLQQACLEGGVLLLYAISRIIY